MSWSRWSIAVPTGRHRRQDTPSLRSSTAIQEVYWSSTTSLYEPDWTRALYLDKGAAGVGQKTQARFYVWAARD